MKLLLTMCLLVTSCGTPMLQNDNDITKSLSYTHRVGQRDSISSDDKFYVSFEFIVQKEQIDLHPGTAAGFQLAIEEWMKHLPIRVTVGIHDKDTPPEIVYRTGIINVVIADIQAAPFSMEKNILGLWWPRDRTILLDADYLDTNSDQAFSVALHELGHVFGVPHVYNMSELATTGSLVVPIGTNAEKYVMYPRSVHGEDQKTLSAIEIVIANHNVMHWWTNTSAPRKIKGCELTH